MTNLGTLLRSWRLRQEITIRKAAKELGFLSPATLSRLENGRMPDTKIMLALLNWLLLSTGKRKSKDIRVVWNIGEK